MKAVVQTGVRSVAWREWPDPVLERGDDVILRTSVAGLCGSDLHYFIADNVAGERIPFPAVVGHECAAVVEAVGPAVTRAKPGDRVAIEPSISCGTCDQCLAGRFNTCRNIRFLGHPGDKDGCFAEFFVMPERNCYVLPSGLTDAEAMLAEPLSIALHSLDLADPHTSASIAVLGSGPIGLCLIMAAKRRGTTEIFATDRSDVRAAAAIRAGAAWSSNPGREDIVRTILARRPLGLEAVFEVSGDPAAMDQAVELVKPGGLIVQIGIPVEERVGLLTRKLRRKEIAIQHVRRQNRRLEIALELIAHGRLDVAWLATHAFPPAEAQRAFATAADRLDGVLKAALVFRAK
jgi:L-iditol 2-dehydrogenase